MELTQVISYSLPLLFVGGFVVMILREGKSPNKDESPKQRYVARKPAGREPRTGSPAPH